MEGLYITFFTIRVPITAAQERRCYPIIPFRFEFTCPPYKGNAEHIHSAIHNCAIGIPSKIYSLFFTDHRVICAKTGRFNASFTGAGAMSGGVLGGLIGAGLDAALSRGKKKTRQLEELMPDQILVADEKNYEILYACVSLSVDEYRL